MPCSQCVQDLSNRQVDREVFWNLKEILYSSDICVYWTIHMLSHQIMCPDHSLLFIFLCTKGSLLREGNVWKPEPAWKDVQDSEGA